MSDTTTPTWGYRPNGDAQIFDLAPGTDLPEGWSTSPTVITDPSLATADALTMRATGLTFAHPAPDVPPPSAAVDADALSSSFAEIERLQAVIEIGMAENARLVAEIEAAEQELDAAAKALSALQAALTAAQADGGFAVSERDAANAALEALKGELAQVKADLDAATAPKPAEAPKTPAKGR